MSNFYTQGTYQMASMGAFGHTELVPADAATGSTTIYCAIQAMEDSAITATDVPGNSAGDTAVDVTLLAGQVIMGNFHTIDVTSGKVWAYLAK